MPGQKILCVAEKPAIAKAVAQHLAGGRVSTVGNSHSFPTLSISHPSHSILYEGINMSRITSLILIFDNGATVQ